MYVTLVIQNISICAYLTNFWINSSLALFFFFFVFFFFLDAVRSISHQYYCDETNSSIITINIVFVIKSLTLSSILPLLLVLLFFSLFILYVFVIFTVYIVIKLTSLLLSRSLASLISQSTFLVFICEFQPLKFSFNQQFFHVH